MSINWYMSLYYKYRDYPITHINTNYKRNELKNIYANIFARLSAYFYIDISHQFQGVGSGLGDDGYFQGDLRLRGKSKRGFDVEGDRDKDKERDNLSSGISSIRSRFFQSNKKVSKKLRSEATHNQLLDQDHIICNKNDISMASIKYFKQHDSPLNQSQILLIENTTNFLKLILNTGKETLCDILMQQQKTQKEGSCYELPDEESRSNSQIIKSSSKLVNNRKVSNQDTQEMEKQRQRQKQKQMNGNGNGNGKMEGEIEIEVIPENNDEINYYFLEFCSAVEIRNEIWFVEDFDTEKDQQKDGCKDGQQSDRSFKRMDYQSYRQISSPYVSLKDIILDNPNRSKKDKDPQSNLDPILLQILGKQLLSSNKYLSRFQPQPQSPHKYPNPTLNIIIETWLQLITMLQDEQTLYDIIKQLVKGSGNPFSEKISSYLHFICLVNTKTLLAKSVSKQNFLCLLPDVVGGVRALTDFRLEKSQGFIKIRDVSLDRYLYSCDAFDKIIKKWRHLGEIISEILIQDDSIFWAKVLQSCCQLLDEYLQEKVQFSYSLILLYQSLSQTQSSSSTTHIKLPEHQRTFYQHSLKTILQRQIGGIQSPHSCSRSQIKSKISFHKASTNSHSHPHSHHRHNRSQESVFICDSNRYRFYDEKVAEREEKILELRQWEKVVRDAVDRLRAYRRVLDCGLEAFMGVPEFITVFFLETYFNLKKLAVYTSFSLPETVQKYSQRVLNSSYLKTLKSNPTDLPTPSKPLLLQLQTHRTHHRQLHKKTTAILRSKQNSSPTHPNPNPNPTNSTHLPTPLSTPPPQQKPQQKQQSLFSQFQTNPEQVPSDGLSILNQEWMVGVVERVRGGEEDGEGDGGGWDFGRGEDLGLLGEVNRYLGLVNQCNFILSVMQMQDSDTTTPLNRRTPQQPTPKTLTTSQLTHSITKLTLQHHNHTKSLMMQTQFHRKTSNLIKIHRLSSVNASNKKNSIHDGHVGHVGGGNGGNGNGGNGGNGSGSQRVDVDVGKIRGCVAMHRECLDIVVMGYCAYVRFYSMLVGSLGCQVCCGLADDQPSSQLDKQPNYRQIASKKWLSHLQSYQQPFTPKPPSSSSSSSSSSPNPIPLPQLPPHLHQQLTLTTLKTELLLIFIYMSSLHIDYLTFSAIYKQELTSYEKMKKAKVIGKLYYQSMHGLYVRMNGGNCGDVGGVGIGGGMGGGMGLEEVKNVYLENLLVVLVGFVQLMYDRTEDADLTQYTTLLKNYFISKANKTSQSQPQCPPLPNLTKIISQSFDWNQQNVPELNQKQLITRLLELRTQPQSQQFAQQLKTIIGEEFVVLGKYGDGKARVEYLEKKLLYFMLRELYFDCYYDVGVFQGKSVQARKNFAMYEVKMVNFFEEIIAKDKQQFLLLKSQQLKQRSAHLKGYLVDYQTQPQLPPQQKTTLQKIVSIFAKTLNLVTQTRQYQMKKRGSNSLSVLRKNSRKSQPIYMHYVSTELVKPDGRRVRVFQNQGYYYFRAIQIYEEMLTKKLEDSQKKYSVYKELGFSVPTSVCIRFLDSDIEAVKQNKESLLALWINHQYKSLHQTKMLLSHQNYLSKIQKLYIDLDVRHKVFQSFKDKILNYEMQKTKIYHQYMDYIRGLKLDVYSHVSGEDPIPYFKLINAIKIYRLDVKKRELQEKIQEEFGKNLSKWNQGILEDMNLYHDWVAREAKIWEKMSQGSKKSKKQLFQIYGIVNKQLKKQQNKTIHMAELARKTKQSTPKLTAKVATIRRSVQKQKGTFR